MDHRVDTPNRYRTRQPNSLEKGSGQLDRDKRVQQALCALRGIRQRYEARRNASSDYARPCNLQVTLDYADMLWIAAAIEALERAVTVDAT
jgi:hypothetical protein